MFFNSIHFLVFFPVITGLYFITPHRLRWLLLLLASYYFYAAWRFDYLLLIVVSTLVDYAAARRMHSAGSDRERRRYLLLSLFCNLGLLFTFKYFGFARESLNGLAAWVGLPYAIPALELLLPVGISFYTFQTLSYTIDVYRRQREPEHHLGKFAAYVAFFPQLVAGPIERSKRLLPQFDEIHRFDYGLMKSGLKLMVWGFFLKLVIADQAGLFVDAVYGNPDGHSGESLLFASYLFAFQIYCDFSGYSHIAIGAARVLGFRLMLNFDRPYFAKNIRESWRRWHISLTSWFRDYLYIPLGGNRNRTRRWVGVVLIVFLTSGLWHGANWTFLAWGFLHAVFMLIGRAKDTAVGRARDAAFDGPIRGRILSAAQVVTTFHLWVLAWIVFRAESLTSAVGIFHGIATRFASGVEPTPGVFSPFEMAAVCIPIGFLLAVEAWQGRRGFVEFVDAQPFAVRTILYFTLLVTIACLGVFEASEFIYFQF